MFKEEQIVQIQKPKNKNIKIKDKQTKRPFVTKKSQFALKKTKIEDKFKENKKKILKMFYKRCINLK